MVIVSMSEAFCYSPVCFDQMWWTLTGLFAPWRKSFIHLTVAMHCWSLSEYIFCLSSKQRCKFLHKAESHSPNSINCVCLCAMYGLLFHVLRRVTAGLTLSWSPHQNKCVWNWMCVCKVPRKLSSSESLTQYRSGWVMLKIFIFVTFGCIVAVWYSQFAFRSLAFTMFSWVFCWMALLSFGYCSFIIFHINLISDCVVGSGLLV